MLNAIRDKKRVMTGKIVENIAKTECVNSMIDECIAHKAEDGRTESIAEHLEKVAQRAAEFAEKFDSFDLAYNMGLLHDVGKYSKGFQHRIKENGPKVDHSTVGALVTAKWKNDFGSLLSYAIAGHHTGLPDGKYAEDGNDEATLDARFKKIKKSTQAKNDKCLLEGIARTTNNLIKKPHVPQLKKPTNFSLAFWTRMMFSCLVDADYLETEAFMQDRPRARMTNVSTAELRDRLEEKLAKFYPPTTTLNIRRCQVLDDCKKAAQGPSGFYSLTVPTGGGKTLASLRFALQHSTQKGADGGRVIYAIPYTSIIEQNACVFKEYLGDKNVLEHYSGFHIESEDESFGCFSKSQDVELANKADLLRLATENWDAPLIVTTNVQLFESLYASKTSKCRKLHNLVNSTIILDEVQTLPIEQIKPCLEALRELVENYGCTVVFCTATQPGLEGILEDIPEITEICSFKEELFEELNRVTYHYIGKQTDEELVKRLNECHQALCIVNSRKQAVSLYEELDDPDAFCLTTFRHAIDREKTIAEIHQRLDSSLPCKVISTSLVEAGVDVDFPIVFRAMSGADSILQAAGRCNRNGIKQAEDSPVYIFESGTEYKIPPETMQRATITRTVLRCAGYNLDCSQVETNIKDITIDLSSLEILQDYFEELYSVRQDGLDKKSVYESLATYRNVTEIPFRQSGSNFKMIEDEECFTVIIPNEEIEADIQNVRNGYANRDTFARLSGHSINIYAWIQQKLMNEGAIEALTDDTFLLNNPTRYDSSYGLKLEIEPGQSVMW